MAAFLPRCNPNITSDAKAPLPPHFPSLPSCVALRRPLSLSSDPPFLFAPVRLSRLSKRARGCARSRPSASLFDHSRIPGSALREGRPPPGSAEARGRALRRASPPRRRETCAHSRHPHPPTHNASSRAGCHPPTCWRRPRRLPDGPPPRPPPSQRGSIGRGGAASSHSTL